MDTNIFCKLFMNTGVNSSDYIHICTLYTHTLYDLLLISKLEIFQTNHLNTQTCKNMHIFREKNVWYHKIIFGGKNRLLTEMAFKRLNSWILNESRNDESRTRPNAVNVYVPCIAFCVPFLFSPCLQS